MALALITGGSKGIGRGMALNLAKRGYDLALIARSEAELLETKNDIEKLASVKVHTLALDLSRLESVQKLYDWSINHNFDIEILINNAGYGCWGYFDNLSLDNQVNMINLNIVSLTAITHLFLPILKQKKQAYILNIGSTAAYQAVPSMAAYSGSKSYVVLFTRALRYELKKTNVSVTCFSPGATASNFTQRAGMQAMQKIADKFNMDTQLVADLGIKAMFAKKAEYIPGILNKISVLATYWLPKSLIETFAANLYLKNLE